MGDSRWYDADAGPLVRPYTMTGGRTRAAGTGDGTRFDLIALITAMPGAGTDPTLGPEHTALLHTCRAAAVSVAELAACADLPIGVVRVLLGDLLQSGLIRVRPPLPHSQLPDEHLLREVINGLRAL